jgi:hypothetical protein
MKCLVGVFILYLISWPLAVGCYTEPWANDTSVNQDSNVTLRGGLLSELGPYASSTQIAAKCSGSAAARGVLATCTEGQWHVNATCEEPKAGQPRVTHQPSPQSVCCVADMLVLWS